MLLIRIISVMYTHMNSGSEINPGRADSHGVQSARVGRRARRRSSTGELTLKFSYKCYILKKITHMQRTSTACVEINRLLLFTFAP